MNLYDKLIMSQLFIGMTSGEMMQVIGQTKFAFRKFAPGRVVRTEGEPCSSMAFLIGGCASAVTAAADRGYSFGEEVSAPYILQPERLFGLTQRYTATFVARTECDIVEIGKDDIIRLSDEFLIFRINLFNILSTAAQKSERKLRSHTPDSIEGRIARFFSMHCSTPAGPKTVRIKMTRLAHELGAGRLAVSRALNALEREGKLHFSRGTITIPALEQLL